MSNPTHREDTGPSNYMGHHTSATVGNIVQNEQMANPTHREDTGQTEYFPPVAKELTYAKAHDVARDTLKSTTIINPNNGSVGAGSFLEGMQNRDIENNMYLNERKQIAVTRNRTREVGGASQVSSLRAPKENFGYLHKETSSKNTPHPSSSISQGLVHRNPTRDPESLQKRINIFDYVDNNLIDNPYINNAVFKSTGKKDNLRKNTFEYTREVNKSNKLN